MNLPDKTYSVIYADPPWSYRQCGTGPKSRGNAVQHYHTMAVEDICALPVQRLAGGGGCALFMWATFPTIPDALRVMRAWGFEYKTAAFVWVKKNRKSGTPFWGMGAYTRANAEVCLLGITPDFKAKEQIKSHAVHQNCRGTDTGAQRKAGRGSEAHRNLDGRRTQNRAFCEAASDWMGRLGRRAAAGVTKEGGT